MGTRLFLPTLMPRSRATKRVTPDPPPGVIVGRSVVHAWMRCRSPAPLTSHLPLIMHFAAIMHFPEVHDRREVHDQRRGGVGSVVHAAGGQRLPEPVRVP